MRPEILRIEKRLPTATLLGLEDILGKGGEVPSEKASLWLMAAHSGGVGSQAEREAMGPLERFRLGRAPHVKYVYSPRLGR